MYKFVYMKNIQCPVRQGEDFENLFEYSSRQGILSMGAGGDFQTKYDPRPHSSSYMCTDFIF